MPLTTPLTVLLRLLVWGVLLGAGFGAAYDMLRITRVLMGVRYSTRVTFSLARAMPPRRIAARPHHMGRSLRNGIIHIEDFLFFLLVGAGTAVFLSAVNHGRVRWLALAGIFAGFALYRLTAGRLVIACSSAIAAVLHLVLAWLLWLLTRPFCLLNRGLRRLGRAVWHALWPPIYTRLAMRRCLRRLDRAFRQGKEGSA